jgi:hypothetical protein
LALPPHAATEASYCRGVDSHRGGIDMSALLSRAETGCKASEKKIITLRNQQVILDSDVADLYGVETSLSVRILYAFISSSFILLNHIFGCKNNKKITFFMLVKKNNIQSIRFFTIFATSNKKQNEL